VSALIEKSGAIIIPRWVAAVAQLVEQRIRNAKVVSSIPISGTSKINKLYMEKSRCFLLSCFM
jgi:hypothetical protein